MSKDVMDRYRIVSGETGGWCVMKRMRFLPLWDEVGWHTNRDAAARMAITHAQNGTCASIYTVAEVLAETADLRQPRP